MQPRHGMRALAACGQILDPVLVYAEATNPDVRAVRVQLRVPAIVAQGVRDVAHRVAPRVAQHEVRERGMACPVDAINVCGTRPAVPRALDLLAFLPDDLGHGTKRTLCA